MCVDTCALNAYPLRGLQSLLLHKYSFAEISIQLWPKYDIVFFLLQNMEPRHIPAY